MNGFYVKKQRARDKGKLSLPKLTQHPIMRFSFPLLIQKFYLFISVFHYPHNFVGRDIKRTSAYLSHPAKKNCSRK